MIETAKAWGTQWGSGELCRSVCSRKQAGLIPVRIIRESDWEKVVELTNDAKPLIEGLRKALALAYDTDDKRTAIALADMWLEQYRELMED